MNEELGDRKIVIGVNQPVCGLFAPGLKGKILGKVNRQFRIEQTVENELSRYFQHSRENDPSKLSILFTCALVNTEKSKIPLINDALAKT